MYFETCNRCDRRGNLHCFSKENWPAKDGNFYGTLCSKCDKEINHKNEWEEERLSLVPKHSE